MFLGHRSAVNWGHARPHSCVALIKSRGKSSPGYRFGSNQKDCLQLRRGRPRHRSGPYTRCRTASKPTEAPMDDAAIFGTEPAMGRSPSAGRRQMPQGCYLFNHSKIIYTKFTRIVFDCHIGALSSFSAARKGFSSIVNPDLRRGASHGTNCAERDTAASSDGEEML